MEDGGAFVGMGGSSVEIAVPHAISNNPTVTTQTVILNLMPSISRFLSARFSMKQMLRVPSYILAHNPGKYNMINLLFWHF